MNTTNAEINTPVVSSNKQKYKNVVIAVLGAFVIGLTTYTITDKNKTSGQLQLQQSQIAKVVDEKSSLQNNFDASLARLDSMATINTGLETKLTEKSAEIAKVKTEIRSILNKKNATAFELGKAKKLIAELNGKITGMEADIAKLTEENKTLSEEKIVLTQAKEKLGQDLANTTTAKQELEKKVDIASTLNATNIVVTPINIKANGKEKVSTSAKKVDKLLISFEVDNRIAKPGSTDLYVLVTGPDGQLMQTNLGNAGTFTTREEGEKPFTAKVPVDVETARKKNVEFGFTPGSNFQKGSYKIQIYQNGFLIGEAKTELRKGGLFG